MVNISANFSPGGTQRNYNGLTSYRLLANGREKYGRGGRGVGGQVYSRKILFVQPAPQTVKFPFNPADYTYTYFNWPPWYQVCVRACV